MSAAMIGKLGRFQRTEDGNTWEDVDPQKLRRRLSGYYHDVDLALRTMVENPGKAVITTGFTRYRFHKEAEQCPTT